MKQNNLQNFSDAGAAKLREMSEKDTVYTDFLKFQGRVFKQNPAIALEFFAQKPNTEFIATAEQWVKAGYSIKTGGNSIHFVDENGKHSDLFDFSQVTGNFPPPRWTLNAQTAAQVKTALGIDTEQSLLRGITSEMLTNSHIADSMERLGVPPKDFKEFQKSFITSVQTVIAGRFEVGGGKFNVIPDSKMFKEYGTDFLAQISESAKEILLKVEEIANEIVFKKAEQAVENRTETNNERVKGEEHDLSRVEQSDRRGESEITGEHITGNPASGVEERSDVLETNSQERGELLGDTTGRAFRESAGSLSGIQDGNSIGETDSVQIRPDLGNLQHGHQSGGMGTVNRGRTDRELRDGVDELDEGTPQGESVANAIETHLSDGGEVGGQGGVGVQGTVRQSVRGNEPPTNELRGHSEMGNNEEFLHRQRGDEGESADSGNTTLDKAKSKLNSVIETSSGLLNGKAADTSALDMQTPVADSKATGVSLSHEFAEGDVIQFEEREWQVKEITNVSIIFKNTDPYDDYATKTLYGDWKKQLDGYVFIENRSIPETLETSNRKRQKHIDPNQPTLFDLEDNETDENTATAKTDILAECQRIKLENGNAVIMWQIGDFYEMYEDDARIAATTLGHTVTERRFGDNEPVRMVGIPKDSLNFNEKRLTEAGYNVAISHIGDRGGDERRVTLSKPANQVAEKLYDEDNTAHYFFHDTLNPDNGVQVHYKNLGLIKEKADKYVIYADALAYSDDNLKKNNITFYKLPRDWGLISEKAQERIAEVSPERTEYYKADWEKMREFREVFDTPENSETPEPAEIEEKPEIAVMTNGSPVPLFFLDWKEAEQYINTNHYKDRDIIGYDQNAVEYKIGKMKRDNPTLPPLTYITQTMGVTPWGQVTGTTVPIEIAKQMTAWRDGEVTDEQVTANFRAYIDGYNALKEKAANVAVENLSPETKSDNTGETEPEFTFQDTFYLNREKDRIIWNNYVERLGGTREFIETTLRFEDILKASEFANKHPETGNSLDNAFFRALGEYSDTKTYREDGAGKAKFEEISEIYRTVTPDFTGQNETAMQGLISFAKEIEQKEIDYFAKEIEESDVPEKQYELSYGQLGRGITVYNAADEVNGNWKQVAYIGYERNIEYYEELPANVQKAIRIKAETSDRLCKKKEYEIGYGHLGNGITVWNRLEEENGDYKTIAHISPERVVSFRDNNLPEYFKEKIINIAETDKSNSLYPHEDILRFVVDDSEKAELIRKDMVLSGYLFSHETVDGKTVFAINKKSAHGFTASKFAEMMIARVEREERLQRSFEIFGTTKDIISFDPVDNETAGKISTTLDVLGITYLRDVNGDSTTFAVKSENAVMYAETLKSVTEPISAAIPPEIKEIADQSPNIIIGGIPPLGKEQSELQKELDIDEPTETIIPNFKVGDTIYLTDGKPYQVAEINENEYDGEGQVVLVGTHKNEIETVGFINSLLKNAKSKVITELSLLFGEETALKLRDAFNENKQEGFKGNLHKERRIVKALYGVFGNNEVSESDIEKAYNILAGELDTKTEDIQVIDDGLGPEIIIAPIYPKSQKPETAPEIIPKPPKPAKTRAHKLYKQFEEMFAQLVSGEYEVMKFGKQGGAFEPLTVEHLGGNRYGFMTWYIQNGDLMRDPDFTFSLDKENKTLNIQEYQQDGVPVVGTVYERVHDDNGNADEKLLAALERNFAQVLKVATDVDRSLTEYEKADGERIKLDNSDSEPEPEETPEPAETEEIKDKTPELRKILNDFSLKHGLGELNVEGRYLVEEMKDGDSFIIGEVGTVYEYDHTPITSDKLELELAKLEKNFPDIADTRDRKDVVKRNGGITLLPKVQKDLPEIVYADNPQNRFWENLTALKELKRIERKIKAGEEPYDNKYNKIEDSHKYLSRYCGWGGLPQVFDTRNSNWARQREQLKETLTADEYEAARETTLNAHYTPQVIIDAMYKAIKNMELPRNAQILEPACGTGNFFRRLPAAFDEAEVTGVEIDSITARIAKHLNPDVRIIESGFERTDFKNNSFDLVIGNVPFGDYNLNDPDYTQDWRIHDAFFRKALDKVALGGVVAFVTSSGTLDKSSPKVREYLATQAELIGAIRMPNNAFAHAGTKVTADMIFLKKRETPLLAYEEKPDWCYTSKNADGLTINNYFVNNPHMVLGKMVQTTFYDRLTCTPIEGANFESQLNEAIKSLNAKITVTKREKAAKERVGVIPADWRIKNFTFAKHEDGKFYYRAGSEMTEFKEKPAKLKQLEQLCALRTETRSLIDLQKTPISDAALVSKRKVLNTLYDGYKAMYGVLNSPSTRQLFHADADYPLLCGLEIQDKETLEYKKSDIFSRRTVNVQIEITTADTIEEALQISLDRRGKPIIQYMAILLGDKYPPQRLSADLSTEERCEKIRSELLEKELCFIDPEKIINDKPYSGIVDKSEYLSGNVREKLKVAETYMAVNPEYKRNVEALQTVIPEDIPAEDISVRMGVSWIEDGDYNDFLHNLSGRSDANSRNTSVHYVPATGEFEITNAGSKKELNLNESTTYGTADYSMYQLAEKILNQRRIAVKKQERDPNDPDKKIYKHDPEGTKKALEKAEKIKKEFKKWIFSDDERKAKYERKYNDMFNCLVGREYDGSHLSFPGMNSKFIMREHQKHAVARNTLGGNSLIAHVVGAGKSAVMFATVMRKKELGLIDKACMVVPKALTEQTANEWRKLYPDARILTVTNDDLSNELKRNMFTARVATGSYDAVVLSQEQYEKIPMSREFRMKFMQKQLDILEDFIRQRKRAENGKRDPTVKQLEQAKKRLAAKIEKLTDPKGAVKAKDDLLEFEQLGFDYLVVDECHAYKNGFVHTKMTNVAGVTTQPSGRAEDMQMKCDYFNSEMGQGHILMATGTPVSNSMTELYVMTRYLRPDLLEKAGISRFDDWAATFGNVTTQFDYTAYKTMKLKTRFSQFANLPELMAFYKEFADIKSANKLSYLERPALVSYDDDGNKTIGKNTIVSVPATPEQKEYVRELSLRAEDINNGRVKPHEDNFLKITGEARLVGLGNGAVKSLYEKRGSSLPPDFLEENERNGKIDACVNKVHKIWEDSHENKGVQLVFSDVAVNSNEGKFSAYEYIRDELIAKGVPSEQIIFAPKADSKNREDIFKKINAGEYRVVIASTGTLGTGANIQERLTALHHCDIPWKPSDFEQREGRILRQGNLNKEVQIFNYVTEDTLDSYMYSIVTNKARFIAQILDNESPARVSEDLDERVLTYAEIQAIAAGNDDVRKRIETTNALAELNMLKREHNYELSKFRSQLESLPSMIETKEEILTKVEADKVQAAKVGNIIITTPNGNTVHEKVNDYLHNKIKEALKNNEQPVEVGTIGGFAVTAVAEKHWTMQLTNETVVNLYIQGENEYTLEAGIGEMSNNVTRLSNFFEKIIPARAKSLTHEIAEMGENLKQAQEQANKPFDRENEIEELTKKLEELDDKLSGITEQKEVDFDPEDEPLVETEEESEELERIYDTDDNDLQAVPDNDTPQNTQGGQRR